MQYRGGVRRLGIWAVVVALFLAPGLALAQSGEFDPALRAVIGRGVSESASIALGSSGSGATVAAPTAPPLVVLPTPTPAPVLVPTPTPVPLVPGEPATYSLQGVNIVAPAEWLVETGFGDLLFEISSLRNDFAAAFLGGGLDFPGLLGVVIIRDQASALLGGFMDDTQLTGVETYFTAQGVPVVEIEFAGMMMDEPSNGALYLFAPGTNAYMLLSFATEEDWAAEAAGLAELAASVTFDAELRTLVTADEELFFADKAETLETLVLPGWHALATDDETFPLMVAEPDLGYVLAFASGETLGDDLDSSAEVMRLLAQMTADADLGRDLIMTMIDSLGGLAGDIDVDASLTALIPTDEGGIVRVVGNGKLDEETTLPIAVYIALRSEGSLGMIVLGNVTQALEEEETTLEILAETLVLP